MFEIKNGSIFLADAHENGKNRCELRRFLHFLLKNGLPPQIFFMGDMFDFLTNADFARDIFGQEIELINEISKQCELFYFEGNHDFNLKKIFLNARVFEFNEQPVVFTDEFGGKFLLSHGDNLMSKFDKMALLWLRNSTFLRFMNFLDVRNFISKLILKSQLHKNLYKKFIKFDEFIKNRVKTDGNVIQGHYHQGDIFEFGKTRYFNLHSFGVFNIFYEAYFFENRFYLREKKFI